MVKEGFLVGIGLNMILSWIKRRILLAHDGIDRWLWRSPIFRVNQKLLASQVLMGQQKLSFLTIDTVGQKLWNGSEIRKMHHPMRTLIFETNSSLLSETDRYIKLRYIQIRARDILFRSNCLVDHLSDEELSEYTGWEKDPVEVLLDRAENASTYLAYEARLALQTHPKLDEYLQYQSQAGRHGLVNRVLAIIVSGGDRR